MADQEGDRDAQWSVKGVTETHNGPIHFALIHLERRYWGLELDYGQNWERRRGRIKEERDVLCSFDRAVVPGIICIW